MRSILTFLFLCFALPVMAQVVADAPEIAPNGFLGDVWQIVQPIVTLFISTVGPAIVVWISARVIGLLKITDENQKLEVEAKLREALHQSALNALLYATSKYSPGSPSVLTSSVVGTAMDYVKEKNPDALKKLGVSDKALSEIIASKVGMLVRS